MRARLAVQSAGLPVELREILLREKPDAFLATSDSGTVPALKDGDKILDESLDIMIWALDRADPEDWMVMPASGHELIAECDGPFKTALDHTKYAVRFPDLDANHERTKAANFLFKLDSQLADLAFLYGPSKTLADMAILPFVRQFANTDRTWFDAQDWPNVIRWLNAFLESPSFLSIMGKLPPWQHDQTPVIFPQGN